jgi:ATP-dependent helicase HrpB
MPTLPILDFRQQILAPLKNGKNIVVTAPTGSGKSTQIPQMLLDSGSFEGRILILQPRRLAARMLAARVAGERGGRLGAEIGFQTRFEKLVTDATRACFITEGILPRMLLSNRELIGVSAIIFDEFHERNLAVDLGLAVSLELTRTVRPDLRLIIMSATIDAAGVANYLGNASIIECPGRSFPITIHYTTAPKTATSWDLAACATADLIAKGAIGDILVFMPGAYEIRRSIEAIERAVRGEKVNIIPLYGDLPFEKQQRVMEQASARKIIVATNIAETSLTIPGVRHVVDSGLARVNRYDSSRGFNTLFIEPISRDSADQRAGRAGREAPGSCIRLWSQSAHAGRPQSSTPEIFRVDLSEAILQLRMLGFDNAKGPQWFEPPGFAAVEAATDILCMLGALTLDGGLTESGKELSEFPMHPRLSRLIIEAGIRGAIRTATFTAALLSERPAISGKPAFPEEATRGEVLSDLFGHYCLLKKAADAGFDPSLCTRFGINRSAAGSIFRTQALYLGYCRRFGISTREKQEDPEALARSLLAAFPDHVAVRRDQGTLICRLRNGRRGELEKDSIARNARYVLVADIREIKTPKGELKTLLGLASGIKEQWLHEDFPHAISQTSQLEWNPVTAAIENRTQTLFFGTIISEKTTAEMDRTKASELLAETIVSKDLNLPTWDQNVIEWIKRLQWVAGVFPDKRFPCFDENTRKSVVRMLCENETNYDRVCQKPVLPVVRAHLDYQQQKFMDAMAPQTLMLPSGKKMRLIYEPGASPRGKARIQDIFNLRETPKVAGGKAPVILEILAPNNRPVQITDDLSRFWNVHYPEIKRTLSRRYPKHTWQ